MTPEQLTRLEKMHSQTQPSALAEIYQWFPEIAKALREAWERDEHHFKVLEQYRLEVEDYRRRMGDLFDQLAQEEADAHQFQKERDVARARLSNLLARIHRDGGHYEAKNGTAKAVVDADVSVAQTFAERDDARAEVERLKAALEEERALACEEPDPKCSCPGCSYAREKASLKEGDQ